MKTVRVAAAVIRDNNRIFATARGYGAFKGKWEFPGGKIEMGETSQEALKREIMEELATEIKVGELIDTIEYDTTVSNEYIYNIYFSYLQEKSFDKIRQMKLEGILCLGLKKNYNFCFTRKGTFLGNIRNIQITKDICLWNILQKV